MNLTYLESKDCIKSLKYWEIYLKGLKNTENVSIEEVEEKIDHLKKFLGYPQ